MMRSAGSLLTKIIATLGPASADPNTIRRMIETGVSIFRINFSHGTSDDHARMVRMVRESASDLKRPIAVMGDLPGPKIRVGRVSGNGVLVKAGSTVIFQREDFTAIDKESPVRFSTTYAGFVDDVKPGERLLVNDGEVRMLIIEKFAAAIQCSVTTGGVISTGKGINLPDSNLKLSVPTDADWKCVDWSLANEIDFLALSFARSGDDINTFAKGIRDRISQLNRDHYRPSIVAKVELPAAVRNIDSILEAADGIMIARGDLGVEMDLAHVPVIQKQLLAAAQTYGRPAIVATQMLQSMIESPTPTRAEASDVAGSILDGADALMLSGETAVGKYPLVAVDHMRRIAEVTESYQASCPPTPTPPEKLVESRYSTAALAHGVWTISQDIGAKLIVVWSQRGGGARYLSQNNFNIPIVAFTSDERVARQMLLLRGVFPVCVSTPEDLDQFTNIVDQHLTSNELADRGDLCLLVAGEPIGTPGVTNRIAILSVGDPKSGFDSP